MESAKSLFEQIEELRRKKEDAEATAELMTPRLENTRKLYQDTLQALELVRQELSGYKSALDEQQSFYDEWTEKVEGYDEEIGRLERAHARAIAEEAARQALLEREDEYRMIVADAPWRSAIKDYQMDGAVQMASVRRGLEADKRGLGKSLISLAYADMIQAERVLIMAPRKTATNFRREVRRWTPARRPIYLVGADKATRKMTLETLIEAREAIPGFTVIINFEAWRRDANLKELLKQLRFDTVIIDETHNIKNFATSAFNGVKEIVLAHNECPECGEQSYPHKVPNAMLYTCKLCGATFSEKKLELWRSVKNLLLMTGSPIMNKPEEIWPQLHLIDPIAFPNEKRFRDDFLIWDSERSAYRWRYGGAERLMNILGMRYISRTTKDVGSERPDPTEEIIEVDFSEETAPDQYGVYKQMEREFEVLLESGETLQAPVVIAQLTRLQQLILWPPSVKIYGQYFDQEKQRMRSTGQVIDHVNVYQSAVLNQIEDITRERVEEDRRVIIFSKYKDAMRALAKRLEVAGISVGVYDGDTTHAQREFIEEEWDARTTQDKQSVLLVTYAAGGESLNFTAADTVITMDRAWNPEVDSQAIGRADRMGNENQVDVIRITTAEPTVFQWIEGINEFKAELIGGWETQVNLAELVRQQIRKSRQKKAA